MADTEVAAGAVQADKRFQLGGMPNPLLHALGTHDGRRIRGHPRGGHEVGAEQFGGVLPRQSGGDRHTARAGFGIVRMDENGTVRHDVLAVG